MEILDIFAPKPEDNCNLMKCKLTDMFSSTKKMQEFDRIPLGSRPMKDTFVMPAGGAVVTRIFTRGPAPWLAHCHTEVHQRDGMGFIMNVGDYSAPIDDSWLPQDFPTCDSPFHQSRQEEPHCDCYIDNDAVLGLALDETYKCSRPYLCMWQQSQVATLRKADPREAAGSKLQSTTFDVPGWAISFSVVCIVTLITLGFAFVLPRCNRFVKADSGRKRSLRSFRSRNEGSSFWIQFKALLILRWDEYRPITINVLRVIEVVGLGLLAGFLFQDVGNNTTATGLSEKTSLLFFSTTLWCQTRMYPAISNYFDFKKSDVIMVLNYKADLLPVFLSRMAVVCVCEMLWPILFVLCSYPLASMFGSVSKVIAISIFLVLNNSCYIAIGALLGTLMPNVNLGMIGATLFAQTTVICAGFFTELPSFVGWIRYVSPIFYAFKGIIKTAFNWDNTYDCPKGQNSAVPPNACYLEMSPAIDDLKQRGINVATFGDPSSSRVYMEAVTMILLYVVCHLSMFFYFKLVLLKVGRDDYCEVKDEQKDDKTKHQQNSTATTHTKFLGEEDLVDEERNEVIVRRLGSVGEVIEAGNSAES